MPDKPSPITLSLRGMLHAVAGLVCALTICGFLGGIWWGFDLAAHFRFQYLIVSSLAAVPAAWSRPRAAAVPYAACALVNLVLIAPLYWRDGPRPANARAHLRVMLLNVHSENLQHPEVAGAIRNSKADIVILQEINARWQQPLAHLHDLYPHILSDPREDNFGIALLSARRPASAEITYFGNAEVPSIVAQFDIGDQRVLIIATHPVPPVSRSGAALHDGQLDAIAAYLTRRADLHRSVLVVGDLNATRWSYSFRRFLRQTSLRDSSRGFGFRPTWPTTLPPLLIPIDHCLVSKDLAVVQRTTGPRVGSDHYPLLVDLGLTRN